MMDKIMNRTDVPKPSANGYGTYQDTLDTLEKAITPESFMTGDRPSYPRFLAQSEKQQESFK